MKVRIKFSKRGAVKFVGHLDILRYFQKAMRRANVDIKYSEGYSPHQIMSFAAPLGVGLESVGEYMDIEVHSIDNCEALKDALNHVMAEGIEVRSCCILDDHARNAMSLVSAADYTVLLREEYRAAAGTGLWENVERFLAQDSIMITKKTKKGVKDINLKPLLYKLSTIENGIFMNIAAGSELNVKPELVIEAYCRFCGIEFPQFAFHIERQEIYGTVEHEGGARFVPLEWIGVKVG